MAQNVGEITVTIDVLGMPKFDAALRRMQEDLQAAIDSALLFGSALGSTSQALACVTEAALERGQDRKQAPLPQQVRRGMSLAGVPNGN